MSLYREVRGPRRWWSTAVAAALVVGLGAGWAGGRATAPEPSLAEAVGETRERVGDVLAGIELVEIEYSQGTVEPAAARAAAARARTSFSGVESDLSVLDPVGSERVDTLLAELEALVARGAPEVRVRDVAERAADDLRAIVGS
jgi:hypothetical protein